MPEVDESYFADEVKGIFPDDKAPMNSLVPMLEGPNEEASASSEEVEEAQFEEVPDLVPPPVRGIDLSTVKDRRGFIVGLCKNFPVNDFNLPLYLYRPDLIDIAVIQTAAESEDLEPLTEMLRVAEVQLDYTEGFPAVETGTPIWGRLPFEEDVAFSAFLQYLDQPGTRMVSMVTAYAPDDVRNWQILNYWQIRALAYDMYRVVHAHRLRERRILQMNDTHFIESEKAFNKLAKVLGDKLDDLDAMKDMSVNDVTNALEKIVKIQRLAMGLSSTGKDETPKNSTNVEVAMREVSQTAAPQIAHDDNTDMSAILADPKLLAKAQEVVIRVTNSNQ